jgi:hypothetical protein
MFMHWYHHALTGYFAFVNFYADNAYLVWAVWMNYLIHFWMYRYVDIKDFIQLSENTQYDIEYVDLLLKFSYYCFRALRVKIPPQVAQFITSSQMVQVSLLFIFKRSSLKFSLTPTKIIDFQFLAVIAAMTHAQIKMQSGEKVAATPYGLFIGQWTMWTYLVLWLRFYYISYYGNGGKKYVQHQEVNKAASVKAQ